MPTETIEKTDVEEEEKTESTDGEGDWCVVLINDEQHTFGQVIRWLMQYADHNKMKAKNIAYMVDSQGKAVCYTGSEDDCEDVSSSLESHGLNTEVKENS